MRIALVTYHFGYNEGTMLQAYASLKLLQRNFPNSQVDILDWRYPTKEKIAFQEPTTARERAIRCFFDRKLALSKDVIRSPGPQEPYQYLHENYSLVVIGSDEVWRLGYSSRFPFGIFGTQRENPWVPPFPNVYWPASEEFQLPCVSLSSSISDNDSIKDIPFRDRRLMRAALLRISPMSVRDERTECFVKRILGSNHPDCRWMPDPTFSLIMDHAGKARSARQQLDEIRNRSGRKIALIVSVRKNSRTTVLFSLLRANGYTTVSLSGSNDDSDFDLNDREIDPIEWAHFPQSADLVVTERFHGAVFAIRNNTPVIALGYRSQRSLIPSKLCDLFRRFGIQDYFLDMARWCSASGAQFEGLLEASRWPASSINETNLKFSRLLDAYASELRKRFDPGIVN
jgi:hypothetical protein